MRIVIISDWFAEKMGYAENCLPKALASLGHEVHLVTSNVQVYFDSPNYKEIYEPFIGPPVVPCETKQLDGYTLHRLPYTRWRGRLRIQGLLAKLRSLRPQIVQTFDAWSVTTYEAALAKPVLRYKLFTGNHICASVFPLANGTAVMGKRARVKWFATVSRPGRLVSYLTEKCYPATVDCADIALRFLGVQERKISVCPLGVDTQSFSPVANEAARNARLELRRQLGFAPTDIVCIHTGRFSQDKNPLCLAQAIERLVSQAESFRGLFLGGGPQESAIRACPGSVVHPFVSARDLPPFYRAADIAVWPTQESTSMLDAAACGIPLVISDHVAAIERVQGNGIKYQESDPGDLSRALLSLRDVGARAQLGDFGAVKMAREFSWTSIAHRRLEDYKAVLR